MNTEGRQSATDLHKLNQLQKLTEGDYQAFLYDCDGTLADNMQAHKSAYAAVAAEHGIDLDTAIIDELAGWPTVAVAGELQNRYKVQINAEVFADRKSQLYVDQYIAHTQPITFVVAHLEANAGKVKIGIVSGGRRSTVSRTLQVLGITGLVDVLVCAGDTEHGKPHPDPFLRAAELLHVSPDRCMVFEDAEAGCIAAEAAGMKWIRIDKI